MKHSVLVFVIFLFGFTKSWAQAPVVATYNDWEVYHQGNICYSTTKTSYRGKRINLYRSTFPDGRKAKNSASKDVYFSVMPNNLDYKFIPLGKTFSMQVGSKKFQFNSAIDEKYAGAMWGRGGDSDSLDTLFAKASSANLSGRDLKNTYFTINFSLMGFTKAAKFMERQCGAKPLNVNIAANNKRCTVNSPSSCSIPQICEMAKSFESIANYAKSFNYNCEKVNITSSSAKKKECSVITPSYCSSYQICQMAKSSYSVASYAKRNNYNCEKEKITTSVSNNKRCTVNSPSYCNSPQICEMAKSFESIANYAKRNNYDCGISENKIVSKSKSCLESPELCTVAQLCKNSTKFENGKKVWRTDYTSQKFIKIAKNNGLTCNVKEQLAQDENQKMVPASSGTGFYVSKEGHIITNEHVIEKCRQVFLHKKGEKPLETSVMARDVVNDLALLKANVKPEIIFPISDDSPYLTQDVTAAGYPMISTLGAEVKVTKGIVSALSAPEDFSRIQVDAAVQPGNSGGPIFDEFGNVLGVVVSGFSDMQNVNFGIKASVVKNLLVANMVELMEPRKSSINWRNFSSKVGEGTVLLSCWMTKSELAHLRKNNDKNRLLFDD